MNLAGPPAASRELADAVDCTDCRSRTIAAANARRKGALFGGVVLEAPMSAAVNGLTFKGKGRKSGEEAVKSVGCRYTAKGAGTGAPLRWRHDHFWLRSRCSVILEPITCLFHCLPPVLEYLQPQ